MAVQNETDKKFMVKDLTSQCCQWALDGLCDRSWQRIRELWLIYYFIISNRGDFINILSFGRSFSISKMAFWRIIESRPWDYFNYEGNKLGMTKWERSLLFSIILVISWIYRVHYIRSSFLMLELSISQYFYVKWSFEYKIFKYSNSAQNHVEPFFALVSI